MAVGIDIKDTGTTKDVCPRRILCGINMHQEHKTTVHKIIVLRKIMEDIWLIEVSVEIMVEHRTVGEHKTLILVICQAKNSVITLGLMAIGIEET